ncbi:MAG: hypothetical protein MUC90_02880 [Thermoplasmata archaeon]|nr:hypothetical protein [Thermoplasmata archaeon]
MEREERYDGSDMVVAGRELADRVFLVCGETLQGPLKEGWQARAEESVAACLPRLERS